MFTIKHCVPGAKPWPAGPHSGALGKHNFQTYYIPSSTYWCLCEKSSDYCDSWGNHFMGWWLVYCCWLLAAEGLIFWIIPRKKNTVRSCSLVGIRYPIYWTTHTLLFHTYQHLSTPKNWALSSLCFSVFLFLSFSRITLTYIYSLYFFFVYSSGLSPPLSHTCVMPVLLGIPCLVPVAIICVDLFLVSSCSSFPPNTQPH